MWWLAGPKGYQALFFLTLSFGMRDVNAKGATSRHGERGMDPFRTKELEGFEYRLDNARASGV